MELILIIGAYIFFSAAFGVADFISDHPHTRKRTPLLVYVLAAAVFPFTITVWFFSWLMGGAE